MSKQAAIQAVTVILSGYHLPIGFDRAAFMAATVDGLADYPDDLLAYVANPKTGVARKSEFIPNLAKMCAHMDEEWDRRRKQAEFERREAERKLPPPERIVSPETRARVSAEFEKLRKNLMASSPVPMGGDETLRTKEEIKRMAEMWLDNYKASPPKSPKLSKEAKGFING